MGLLDAALPDGRRWTRVGDCFEVTRKPRGLRVAEHETVPFVPMEAIPQGGHYEPRYDTKPSSHITSGTYFERGDLLIAKITPSFENGKQAWAEGLPATFGYATTEVIPLRPNAPGNDRRLLFFYLLHPEIRSFVSERMEGSTGRQRVPEQVLLELPYPELPPEDQHTIADTLERVTRQIELEERSARTSAELKRSAMRELFTRGLRGEPQKDTEIGLVPESWKVEPIGAHFSVVSGGTPSRGNPAFWTGGTIPWVKTTEVDYCVITETEERITVAGLENSAAKLLPEGTLLMAMYGQGVTRGKVAILGIESACNQACAAMLPFDDAIRTRYLYHFLAWRYDEIRSLAHGGQQQNLNLDIVRSLPVAAPCSQEEQDDIVTILDAIDRKIDLHRKKRAVLEELFQALLHKLMTGEIRVADLDLSALGAADVASNVAEAGV